MSKEMTLTTTLAENLNPLQLTCTSPYEGHMKNSARTNSSRAHSRTIRKYRLDSKKTVKNHPGSWFSLSSHNDYIYKVTYNVWMEVVAIVTCHVWTTTRNYLEVAEHNEKTVWQVPRFWMPLDHYGYFQRSYFISDKNKVQHSVPWRMAEPGLCYPLPTGLTPEGPCDRVHSVWVEC